MNGRNVWLNNFEFSLELINKAVQKLGNENELIALWTAGSSKIKVINNFKYSRYLNTSDADWNKDFDNDIEFVTGNEWKAGNLSYHLKSRPKWEGFSKSDILNNSSQFICVDDVCLGRY